jgi:hypothetical protein
MMAWKLKNTLKNTAKYHKILQEHVAIDESSLFARKQSIKMP